MQLRNLFEAGTPAPGPRGVQWIACEDSNRVYHFYSDYEKKFFVTANDGQLAAECRAVKCAGIIYIAGPMRGYPLYNFPAFDAAAEYFVKQGFYVFNPADLDRAHGITETTDPLPPHFMRAAMQRDTEVITKCTHVALLNGWEGSAGVGPEGILANVLSLSFLTEGDTRSTGASAFLPAPRQAIAAVIGARLVGVYQKFIKDQNANSAR